MMFSVGSRFDAVWLAHDDAAARKALADIVIGIADEVQRDAACEEGAEALPRRAGQRDLDRVFRQAGMAELARDFAGQHRADRAVHVVDRSR